MINEYVKNLDESVQRLLSSSVKFDSNLATAITDILNKFKELRKQHYWILKDNNTNDPITSFIAFSEEGIKQVIEHYYHDFWDSYYSVDKDSFEFTYGPNTKVTFKYLETYSFDDLKDIDSTTENWSKKIHPNYLYHGEFSMEKAVIIEFFDPGPNEETVETIEK